MKRIEFLQKELGSDYKICIIDLERCLYRDFGNGFNVEISGVNSRKKDATVTLYLYFGDDLSSYLAVKSVHGIERTADAIHNGVESLREYAESLLAQGYNTKKALFELVEEEIAPKKDTAGSRC